ncbi:MAG TPA: 2Fe-2S iron-sulfur cluster-binding protein [Anaeromyxobacteraceae bacterium]|nr:2Fe-2S iron-sulfur cluster-binding protein [Anaeromyxobacteraceae bacterium]
MPRLAAFATDCAITFDGRKIPARTGESIASALLAAGIPLVARSAKYHRPRGPFCLAGSCGSCLVRAGGMPGQRACRTACRDGLRVTSQNAFPGAAHDLLGAIDLVFPRGIDHHHLMTGFAPANRAAVAFSRRLAGMGRLPDTLPPAAAAPGEDVFDALVVGAGPAGLGAAEALAAARRRILLAEAEPALGGRLRARLGLPGEPDAAWPVRVADAVRAAGGEAAAGGVVLGLWRDGGTPLALLREPERLRLVRARRVVLCPGGHPEPPDIPGGDRPGVLAARGVLALLAEHGVLPGERIAVLGSGPEADAAAARLAEAGADARRVPEAVRVLGRGRVRALLLAGGARLPCDAAAVATPPLPAIDLARQLGAAVTLDAGRGAFAVQADASGRTSVPGLLAAGEATGIPSTPAAVEAGRRAGTEAARA